MQSPQQRKVVNVDRGLFLVRYTSAEDEHAPPSVRFSAVTGSRDDIRFVLHPDEDEPVLHGPGTSLVMLADAPGRLTIDISPSRPDGSVAAKVRIEPLMQGNPVAAPQHRREPRSPTPTASFRMLGHVASRGDVAVGPDAWLAGPAAPARIEGLRLDWPGKPRDLELRYAVKTAQSRGALGPLAGLGTFVGSRGRSQPILGLVLETSGAAAQRYQCSAEMVFLGSPLIRVKGQRIEGRGPTGREPLVGLRVSVEEVAADDDDLTVATAIRAPAPIERVRIFRSDPFSHRPSA